MFCEFSSAAYRADASLTDEDNSPLPDAINGYFTDIDGGMDRMEAYDKVRYDWLMVS